MHPTIAFLALAALLGWLLLLQLALWRSRPGDIDPGPRTLDLGPEPPAVANLLAGGWRMTSDAATATLVDLAARRILGFEQQGPDPQRTVVRVREAHPPGLTPYERRIFTRVSALARGGVVPAAALVRGNQAWAKSWWRGFTKEATADARARGLSRDRWNAGTKSLLRVTALIPVVILCVAVLAAPVTGDPDKDSNRAGLVVPILAFGWGALIALVESVKKERDTPAGRAAAARWLGYRDHIARDEQFPDLPPAAVQLWDRHLAYATAFGIARTTIRVLPLGARSDTLAWSAYGEGWHQVRIRYPRGSWGWSPWVAGLRGLFQLGIGVTGLYYLLRYRPGIGADLDQLQQGAGRFAPLYAIPLVLATLVILRGTVNLIRGLAEYPSRRTTVGEVVRMVRRQTGDSENPSYVHYAAIDDGRAPRTRALLLTDQQWLEVDEGDEVRVEAGPYLGRIFRLSVLAKGERPADAEWGGDGDGGSGAASLLPAAPDVPAPTTLISTDDVGRVLGVPVTTDGATADMRVPLLNVRLCTYTPQRPGYPRIMVQVSGGGMAGRLAGTARRRGQPVPGIEGAYTGGSAERPAVLLLRGAISVGVHSPDKGVNPALLHALARIAADRLPATGPAGPTWPGGGQAPAQDAAGQRGQNGLP
jgi:Predicted membrane protein (DUF2207) C-terminal domain